MGELNFDVITYICCTHGIVRSYTCKFSEKRCISSIKDLQKWCTNLQKHNKNIYQNINIDKNIYQGISKIDSLNIKIGADENEHKAIKYIKHINKDFKCKDIIDLIFKCYVILNYIPSSGGNDCNDDQNKPIQLSERHHYKLMLKVLNSLLVVNIFENTYKYCKKTKQFKNIKECFESLVNKYFEKYLNEINDNNKYFEVLKPVLRYITACKDTPTVELTDKIYRQMLKNNVSRKDIWKYHNSLYSLLMNFKSDKIKTRESLFSVISQDFKKIMIKYQCSFAKYSFYIGGFIEDGADANFNIVYKSFYELYKYYIYQLNTSREMMPKRDILLYYINKIGENSEYQFSDDGILIKETTKQHNNK